MGPLHGLQFTNCSSMGPFYGVTPSGTCCSSVDSPQSHKFCHEPAPAQCLHRATVSHPPSTALRSFKGCRWISAGVDLHGLLQDSRFPTVSTTGCSDHLSLAWSEPAPGLTAPGPAANGDPYCTWRHLVPSRSPAPLPRPPHASIGYATACWPMLFVLLIRHRSPGGLRASAAGWCGWPGPPSRSGPALPSPRCGFPPTPHGPGSSPQPTPALKSRGWVQGVSRLSSRFQDKGKKRGRCLQLSGLLKNPKVMLHHLSGEARETWWNNPAIWSRMIKALWASLSWHCFPLSFCLHIPMCMYTKRVYKTTENLNSQISYQSNKIPLFGWVILQFPLLLRKTFLASGYAKQKSEMPRYYHLWGLTPAKLLLMSSRVKLLL